MDISLSKEFQSRIVALKRSGKKSQYQQSMMVLSEVSLEVKVSKIFRKETRIPNCYKYELPEGYRIVFQKVEGTKDKFLALTVGSHDEVDRFLDNHKGWIFDPVTHGLRELRLSTVYDEHIDIVRSPELKIKQKSFIEEKKTQCVFDDLNDDLLMKAGIPQEKIQQALSLSDPDSLEVMVFLESLNSKTADLLLAFITGGQETRNEIKLTLGGSREYHPFLSKSILSGIEDSSDQFVHLRELPEEQRAFESLPFEDWMLFLHPDQKSLVSKEFNGPVRLRGVSGSGKTVVAIHRARHIAREIIQYGTNEYVLFLTFNKSLAELVENLINQLCLTAEHEKIQVSTVDKWCKDFVTFIMGNLPPWQESIIDKVWFDSVIAHIESLKSVGLCPPDVSSIHDLKHDKDIQFLKDEVKFIFGKFVHMECGKYLYCDRTGRVRRLSKNQRTYILEFYQSYHLALVNHKQYISKELNRVAFDLLRKGELPKFEYRSIIVDESQDLSEIELRAIKEVSIFGGEKLFLVGDGAQRIYTRGYSMKNLGINVVGRSFLLKKNYRNTKEIMRSAALLMESQGIGKYDEDPEIAQTIASFSSHSAEKPLLMIAETPKHEWNAIAREIRYLTKTLKILPHEICCLSRSNWERKGIKNTLNDMGIESIDYRADGIGSNDCIKISSLHNSKGHEFRVIFIAGLFEGAVPLFNSMEPENLEKEAALLYVAITRAKHLLYLSYPKIDQNGRRLKPSRFLDDMKDALEILELYFDPIHNK